MSTQSPTVSVAMAVYNAECYVSEAIDSILNQTFTDFELLIIDDGSTDGSLKILQDYAAKDDRISINHQENQGIFRTRNTLLHQSRGEFIAVMDADDIALPERLERQVAFLQQHQEVVCVGSSLDWIDEKGRFIGHNPMPESDEELQRFMIGGISLMHHPTVMARRSVILQVGGYDDTFKTSGDLDLWLRMGEIGKLANIKESLTHYRLHSRSITSAKQKQQTKDSLRACQKAWERRGLQGEFVRSSADHINQYEFWLRYAQQGINNSQYDVAHRCALRAVKINPLRQSGWKLLIRAFIFSLIPS